MVLEKLMAYTTWSQNNPHNSRGDSSIIYLDGVTPPKRALVSRSSSGGNLYAKAQHHQRLLQTIREDDSESRLVLYSRINIVKVSATTHHSKTPYFVQLYIRLKMLFFIS